MHERYELRMDQMGLAAGAVLTRQSNTIFQSYYMAEGVGFFSEGFVQRHPEIFRPVRWRPKEGDIVFVITPQSSESSGVQSWGWDGESWLMLALEQGRVFRTQSDAERVAKLTRELWEREGGR